MRILLIIKIIRIMILLPIGILACTYGYISGKIARLFGDTSLKRMNRFIAEINTLYQNIKNNTLLQNDVIELANQVVDKLTYLKFKMQFHENSFQESIIINNKIYKLRIECDKIVHLLDTLDNESEKYRKRIARLARNIAIIYNGYEEMEENNRRSTND